MILLSKATIRVAVVAILLTAPVLSSGQDSPVPVIPAASQEPAVDPLKNEDPVVTRVTLEAGRLSAALPEEQAGRVDELFRRAFDLKAADDVRLDAIQSLKEVAGSLDQSDRKMRSLSSQLRRRCRLAETGLKALQEYGADDHVRELVNELIIRACIDYEQSGRYAHTEVVRRIYADLRFNHPAVFQKVSPPLVEDFMNYNIHFVLSEPMLSRLLSDSRTESGDVADCILGAWVTGCQVTDTTVRADIRPSMGQACFNLVVDGRTHSNTQGRKKPATVFTRGNHAFTICKPTYFDGERLTSSHASMDVDANNQTVGVSTDYDKIPIIGRIARKIAWREVQEKHAQSEAIAAQKLRDRALPEFEREVGNRFSEANSNFQNKVLQNLRDRDIAPESYSARSTDSHFAVSSRTLNGETLAATRPPSSPAPRRGLAVQMHESSMNAAIESLGLKGEMTPSEVISRIEVALEEFTGREISLRREDAPVDDNTTFIFDDSDPIRVRFDEGEVIFILRTGFRQKDRNREIPKHVFEIPVGFELADGNLTVIAPSTDVRGILSLRPRAIEGRGNVAQARAIAKELLDKTFKEARTPIDSNVDVPLNDNRKIRLRLTTFELADGWVTGVLQ
ncbi:MAG: hypothetical protein KDA81_15010 [Planctomycetaceae bacterium]|nr:hypothetical protein [Planctomycetaceae bacterium]